MGVGPTLDDVSKVSAGDDLSRGQSGYVKRLMLVGGTEEVEIIVPTSVLGIKANNAQTYRLDFGRQSQ